MNNLMLAWAGWVARKRWIDTGNADNLDTLNDITHELSKRFNANSLVMAMVRENAWHNMYDLFAKESNK